MRTLFTALALSAAVLSSTALGANAQTMTGSGTAMSSPMMMNGHNTRTNGRTVSTMATGRMARTEHMRPRLAELTRDLHRAEQRVQARMHRGSLTRNEVAQLDREIRSIRDTSTRVAQRHDGVIPRREYRALRNDVARLDHQIDHMSRGSMRS